MTNIYTDEYSSFAVQELYSSDVESDQSSETNQREIEEMLYSQIHYAAVEDDFENKKDFCTEEKQNIEIFDITSDPEKSTDLKNDTAPKNSLQDDVICIDAENKTDAVTVRQKNIGGKNCDSLPQNSENSNENSVKLEQFLSLNTNIETPSTIRSSMLKEKTNSRSSASKSFGPIVTVETDSDCILLDSPKKSSIKKSSIVYHDSNSEESDESLYVIDDVDGLQSSTNFSTSIEEDIKIHVKDSKPIVVLDYNEIDGFENMSLEDVINSLEDCDWNIKPADRYQSTSRVASRYYAPITVKCHNCTERGHLSKDCPKPKKLKNCSLCGWEGHLFRSCPNSLCYNCDRPGHSSRECVHPRRRLNDQCNRCGMYGHRQFDCPEIWRQYHSTTSLEDPKPGNNVENKNAWCFNCAKKGHFGYECERDRMDRFTLPTYPFISRYDKHIKYNRPRHKHFEDSSNSTQSNNKRKREQDSPGQWKKQTFEKREKFEKKQKFEKKEQPTTSSSNYTDVLRQRLEMSSKKIERAMKIKEKKSRRKANRKQKLLDEGIGSNKAIKKRLKQMKDEVKNRNNEKKNQKRGKRGGQKKSNDRSVSYGFTRGFQMTINAPNRYK